MNIFEIDNGLKSELVKGAIIHKAQETPMPSEPS
jgi:hypothetical protein